MFFSRFFNCWAGSGFVWQAVVGGQLLWILENYVLQGSRVCNMVFVWIYDGMPLPRCKLLELIRFHSQDSKLLMFGFHHVCCFPGNLSASLNVIVSSIACGRNSLLDCVKTISSRLVADPKLKHDFNASAIDARLKG